MKFNVLRPTLVSSLLLLLSCSTLAQACNDIEDGCLGCSDEELMVCVDMLVAGICDSGGGNEFCDTGRVRDDAERSIITNTGRHMSRIRSMIRSARKYQDPRAPRL